MTRYLYIDQDENNALHINTFLTEEFALACGMRRLQEAVQVLLGEDYSIPPEDVDEDGFIEHYGRREEVVSSPWGWHVFDGISETRRGYIEKINIEDADEPEMAEKTKI